MSDRFILKEKSKYKWNGKREAKDEYPRELERLRKLAVIEKEKKFNELLDRVYKNPKVFLIETNVNRVYVVLKPGYNLIAFGINKNLIDPTKHWERIEEILGTIIPKELERYEYEN